MTEAIMLREHGGPAVLRAESIEIGDPGPGQVRLRQTAVGVNFHDCYVRSGLYRTLSLPGIPGLEAAGTVEAVGSGVEGLRAGDRVAYFTPAYGAYAGARLVAADLVVRLPDAIEDRLAASVMVKGLTAQLLLHRVHSVKAGDTILVHAAAGGVGLLLCQWAHRLGATVIGTVGTPEKAALAAARGCEHTILYREESFVERVKDITGGRGVDVAYDSVGRDTFAGSLDCLALLGHLVNFGQSSGPVEPLAAAKLAARSNSLTRPMLFHYVQGRAALEAATASLFAAMTDGTLTVDEPRTFPLREVAAAHRALEARETTGAVVLIP